MNISIAILTPGSPYGHAEKIDVFTSSVDVMRKAMHTASTFSEYELYFSNNGDAESLAMLKVTDDDDADEAAAVELFKELAGTLDEAQKSMLDNFISNWGTFGSTWEAALDLVVKTGEAEQFGDDDMVFPAFGTTSDAARAALHSEYDEEEVDDWD